MTHLLHSLTMDESLFTQNSILKQTLKSAKKQISLLESQLETERKNSEICSANKAKTTTQVIQDLVRKDHQSRKNISELENEILQLKAEILSLKLKQKIESIS